RIGQSVTRDLGRVYVLVNTAAHMVMGEIGEIGARDFWRVVDTNLTGTFSCIRACGPAMAERGFGRIVSVASDWGLTGWPRATAYSASKAGIVSLTKAVARELGPRGVAAGPVSPR